MNRLLIMLLLATPLLGCLSDNTTLTTQEGNGMKSGTHKILNYDQPVSFKINEELSFPDLKITYLKEVDPETGSEITSTASIRYRLFQIKDLDIKAKENAAQEIAVTHGQLPPAPFLIQLKSGSFILYTYKSQAGEDLFPDKLVISRK